MLPPSEIASWIYQHVGQEWSFLNQSGDIKGNHSLTATANYIDAVGQEVPTDAKRTYPATGL